jgi:hypothetical protein
MHKVIRPANASPKVFAAIEKNTAMLDMLLVGIYRNL